MSSFCVLLGAGREWARKFKMYGIWLDRVSIAAFPNMLQAGVRCHVESM